MTEPKLLTEAEAKILWGNSPTHETFDAFKAQLRERGLIAPEPVDALLIVARKQADMWWPDEGALTGSMDGSMWMERILAALKRGMELAKAESQLPYSPPPKWEQDAIPDWAFERVAQLVGYGDKNGPRGSRAGVVFARYIALTERQP